MKKTNTFLIGFMILIVFIIGVSGCQSQSLDSESSGTLITIEDFKPLKDSFIDYKLKIKEQPYSFSIKGKYDLNNDGSKDEINLELQKQPNTRAETYIQVNDIKKEIYMNHTYDGETRLIDLDKNDKFIEIAFFDEGPSVDPIYNFYRYDNNELYKIGDVEDRALINGEGKIFPSDYISDFEPAFYSAWLEIENNQFILKHKNINEYIGKNYILHERNDAFFAPMEEIPEDFHPHWEDEIDFQTTELTLIDIYFPDYDDKLLNFYFVELANGDKGMLYFWLGD